MQTLMLAVPPAVNINSKRPSPEPNVVYHDLGNEPHVSRVCRQVVPCCASLHVQMLWIHAGWKDTV